MWHQIDFMGIGLVYHKTDVLPTTTGRPEIACIEPIKGTTLTTGQRFQLRVWPIANQAYTLKFQYEVAPDYLSGTLPFAYGGAKHSETILESCLAVAEKIMDDRADIHAREFMMKLAVSKDLDRRNKAQLLGPNLDRSDTRNRDNRWHQHGWSPISYNGQQP